MFPVLMQGTQQALTYAATSVPSTAFGISTHTILVTATSNCHVRVGSGTPVAVATDFLIKLGDPPLVLGVAPTEKIAVIQDTAGGVLYVQEVCA